jgi:hypothetical protein
VEQNGPEEPHIQDDIVVHQSINPGESPEFIDLPIKSASQPVLKHQESLHSEEMSKRGTLDEELKIGYDPQRSKSGFNTTILIEHVDPNSIGCKAKSILPPDTTSNQAK